MAGFELSKWYLDCVTDAGEVAIAYTGRVRWGRLSFHYSSVLESAEGRVKVRHSLRAPREPVVNNGSIHWRANALHVDAEWHADSAPLCETLLDDESGLIAWHCLMPRARARFGLRSGFGYAERLTLTVPPWKLPIDTLRWGRFSSASDWIVWIDWRGAHPQRRVYWNGTLAPVDELGDEKIRFADGALLAMDRSLTIRDGALGSTVLAAIPVMGRTFPARLLRVTESKWRSRARLEFPHGPAVEGYAIHERVSWPP